MLLDENEKLKQINKKKRSMKLLVENNDSLYDYFEFKILYNENRR